MTPKQNPQAIGVVLGKVMAELGGERNPSGEEIQGVWRRVVGKHAARHSRPSGLRGGRLYVNVDNPAWLYKLNLSYKKKALAGLKKALGEERVKAVWFRIGEV